MLAARKQQAKHDRAAAAFEEAAAQLEATQAAVADHAAKQAAAFMRALAAGKTELPDHERRQLADEEHKLFGLAADFDLQPEMIPAARAQLAAEAARLAARWQELRRVGRELVCESFEQTVNHNLNDINELRLQVFEIAGRLENIRDLCAAHEAFRNAPEGRSILGTNVEGFQGQAHAVTVWGAPGTLAGKIQLEELMKKWAPIAPGIKHDEPHQAKVEDIVESMRTSYHVPPYSDEERRMERAIYVSATAGHTLRHFRENPESVDVWTRTRLQVRVEQIEADTARLVALQRTPL